MVMPLSVQHTVHSPSANILQSCCSVPQAISSSHEHHSLRPPLHFSTRTLQRGKTHQFAPAPVCGNAAAVPPGAALANADVPVRSYNIVLLIETPFSEPAAQTLAAKAKQSASPAGPKSRASGESSQRRRRLRRCLPRIRVGK